MRSNPKQRSYHQICGGILKSRIVHLYGTVSEGHIKVRCTSGWGGDRPKSQEIPTEIHGISVQKSLEKNIPTEIHGISIQNSPEKNIPTEIHGISIQKSLGKNIPTEIHGISIQKSLEKLGHTYRITRHQYPEFIRKVRTYLPNYTASLSRSL